MRLAVGVRIELLGTAADLAAASCPCLSCRAARRAGRTRAPLRAVVDGALVLTADAVAEGSADHRVEQHGAALLVTGPDGERLAWAPRGADAELPRADVVVLGLTDGLAAWAAQVAALRRTGAVTPTTALVAAPVPHGLPPDDEVAPVLAGWGGSLGADGATVTTPGAPREPARVLVLGGARSGKSAWAEQRVAAEPDVVYVATAPPRPGDAEWRARVAAHVARRPSPWRTVETADVAGVLRAAAGAVLVDDLGLWLTRVVDDAGAWEGPLPAAVGRACDDLVGAWRGCAGTAVVVAPEVGAGVVPATASGRRFRDLLGAVTARLAAGSDEVVQVVAGLPRRLR